MNIPTNRPRTFFAPSYPTPSAAADNTAIYDHETAQVVSNPIFRNTPIFLFLNKKDIFEDMIKKTPLTVCFPDFAGPERDVHAALEYLQEQYEKVMEAAVPGKELYAHVVAARVRMDMKVAWGDVKDQVRAGAGEAERGARLCGYYRL